MTPGTPIPETLQTAMEHHQAGRLVEAEALYRQILRIAPDNPDALHLLGLIAHQVGNNQIAAELMSKAIRINPSASMYNNLGLVFQAQERHELATASYRQALAINPEYAEAHYNLGNTFREQGKLGAAIECYHRALKFHPQYAEAYTNLGLTFKEQGKLDAAIQSYRKALSVRPDFAEAYSVLLLLHCYHASLTPHDYLALARGWEQACIPAPERQAAHERSFKRPPLTGRRLRIGYVSGDFRQHAISYFIEQIFTNHDRARVEIFAYSNSNIRDAVMERLQALADHWIPVMGLPDMAALDQIEADKIDVLVDLSGHTANNRMELFARRAAPVQVHYLGYMASTGLSEMDYFIGDDILTPPETDSHFSEQVWRLPRTWVSYDGKADAPLPDWHPSEDGTVWLGSFNNLGKLTPETLKLWATVLHALPEAKLLLKTKELADLGNRQNILDSMTSHGIAADRIELQPSSITSSWMEHMTYYNRLDIALDPVGAVGGGTTTCDALWMGVPVITLEGDRMASRMTASMLNAIAHPEWIASTETEYVDKVVALSREVQLRKTLRPAQREHMARSPLCDARDLAMKLERAYAEMFEHWQEPKGEQPCANRTEGTAKL